MAWYRTGTLSVTINSKTITGVGTQWANAIYGIGPGQMLLVPGDGAITAYEIASVDSNTKITLVNNYTGATGTGKGYAILNTYVDSVPDFARRLAVQIAYYQSQIEGMNNLYTATGNVTLTAPDGTVVTVPSYKKMTGDMTATVNGVLDLTKFAMKSTSTSEVWRLLGTFTEGQSGKSIKIRFEGGGAFSGGPGNANPQELVVRTGNNPAAGVNAKGRCAATLLNYFYTGGQVTDVRLIESSENNYDVYVKLATYTTNTYYTVDCSTAANSIAKWADKQTNWSGDASTGPTSPLEVKRLMPVNYDVNDTVASSYASASRPAINGFGGSNGSRVTGDPVASQLALLNYLRANGGTQIFRTGGGALIGVPPDGASLHMQSGDVSAVLAVNYNSGNLIIFGGNTAGLADGRVASNAVWGTANTTVDANGFIKKASPIARLANSEDGMMEDFLDGFTLAGCAAINREAAGVFAKRIDTGVYELTGALGFAKESWTMEVPQDVNGNRLCFVEGSFADDVVTVKVFKRKFDVDTAMIVAGAPMDIPAGRWIDLRLDVYQEPEPEYVPEPEPDPESGVEE